jgi:hypothetical protein
MTRIDFISKHKNQKFDEIVKERLGRSTPNVY